MSEVDRALLPPEEAIAALRAELEDKIATLNARSGRLPTGTGPLATLATAAPAGTLLLQGQAVQRADYPDLTAWVQATSAAGFTVGASTLTLPDLRGRVLRGVAASGETVGQQVGADTRAIATANLPAHDHNVSASGSSTGSAGSHDHGGTVNNSGVHSGHNEGAVTGIDNPGGGLSIASSTQNNNGGHTHTFTTGSAGSHSHSVSVSVSESSVGSGTAFDVRQASTAVNYLIWT